MEEKSSKDGEHHERTVESIIDHHLSKTEPSSTSQVPIKENQINFESEPTIACSVQQVKIPTNVKSTTEVSNGSQMIPNTEMLVDSTPNQLKQELNATSSIDQPKSPIILGEHSIPSFGGSRTIGESISVNHSQSEIDSVQNDRRRGMKEFYVLLFDNGKLLGGKSALAISAALFSTALVVCAIALRDITRDAVKIPSGILMGSIGTLTMSCVVITSYIFSPGCRRHSNVLLLNRSVMDLCLAISFLMQPIWTNGDHGSEIGISCQYVSAIREYFIMTSVAWEFCMALDLFSLLNDPFTSPRQNRRTYMILSHVLGILAGGVMLSSSSFYGISVGDFCWVKCSNLEGDGRFVVFDAGIWIFIAVPVAVFLSTNVFVCAVSAKRFRSGIQATLEHRRALLREGFLTTVAFIVYWLLLWSVYIAFWFTRDSTILKELFGLFLSFRGSVVCFLWILYTNLFDGSRTSTRTIADRDDAIRAQTNYALLKELVFYTTRGITKAVQVANKRQTLELLELSIFTVHPPENEHALFSCQECKFTDFQPDIYCRLREFFQIDEREFIHSFRDCSIPKVSEGASGSFMFFTSNGAYIVKSLTLRESQFLNSIIDQYATYVLENPNTLLTRILGSYSMILYGRETFFVVMENLFDKQHAVHHRYDIKGSWIDRNAKKPRPGQECTCRFCNMTFRSGSRDTCPHRAGFHEPNVVLKDMDLTTKVRLSDSQGISVLGQLKSDSDFLCNQGIMDYSLLLGVIEVRFHVTTSSILPEENDHIRLPSIGVVNANANITTKPIAKQSIAAMRCADVVIGPGFFYIGLIDILQTWTWEKQLERFLKTIILRKDPDGISSLPPKQYRDRFHKKLDEIFYISNISNHESPLGRLSIEASLPENNKVYPVFNQSNQKFSFRNEWTDTPPSSDSLFDNRSTSTTTTKSTGEHSQS